VKVEGDATPLFLRQWIHAAPGKRFEQGGLAVIDVPRGADDHAALQLRAHQNSRPGNSAPSPR
jgi:hypothetical protein